MSGVTVQFRSTSFKYGHESDSSLGIAPTGEFESPVCLSVHENAVLQRRSDESDIPFHRLDNLVQLSAPYLFGKTHSEPLGRVEGDMRR